MSKRGPARLIRLAVLVLILASQTVAAPPPAAASGPPAAVGLRAASGATTFFLTQNGATMDGIPPQESEPPHLVLYRNGALSASEERTLIVEVTGIEVPPGGVTVTLDVETQHRDPDVVDGGGRIQVWRESRRIAHRAGLAHSGVTVVFAHEFGATVAGPTGPIPTPTDYFRYQVTVTDMRRPLADPLYTFRQDHAFLMENQWIARLPEVPEGSLGAAPDELVVYYCDMVPFRGSADDAATWVPREGVSAYVGTELVPRMVEAFRVQGGEWGFPWYDAWTSYRPEDAERLSVALTDGETWFHGWAPTGDTTATTAISIRVAGGNHVHYETLADRVMSSFHHELFHNQQRNINLHYGGDGRVSGAGHAWQFYTEGTAALATSVGQPLTEFGPTSGTYMSLVNRFIRWGDGRFGDLITNYDEIDPYYAALYWRFLYERCGGMTAGAEDPAAGMQVIRRVLTALYAREVVAPGSPADLLAAASEVMDQALAGSSCPFQTYNESLAAFARAIYALRWDGGRCIAPGIPAGCELYDPYRQYDYPSVNTIVFTGTPAAYRGEIGSGPHMDSYVLLLAPAADGQSVTIELHSAAGPGVAYHVQLVPWVAAKHDAIPGPSSPPMAAAEILPEVQPDGSLAYVIPVTRTSVYRVGLIVTWFGAQGTADDTGEYTLTLQASDPDA